MHILSWGWWQKRPILLFIIICRIQVAAAEATAEAELRQSLKELREKMDDEREQALEEARLVNKFSQFIAFPRI